MATNTTMKCSSPMKAVSNGIFQNDNPLDFALPLAILQICLVVVLTRFLAFLLKPLRQPRVVAETIGGVLLGPSAFGRSSAYLHRMFPARSLTVLDTLANLGLIFFLFLVGLELDLKSIHKTGKKAMMIAVAGITLPFALGIGTSFILRSTIDEGVNEAPFLVFMGVSLSITAFPVLARILAELKLLTTEVGRLAMSAAAVNDVVAWILLALAIALSSKGHSPVISIWVFLSVIGFVLICAFVIPKTFNWMATRCPEGEPTNEFYVCVTFTIVLAAGFVTDAIGIHALFGAFVVGILIPKEGPFAGALVEKVEDLVSGLFLPLYFVSSGLKTNVTTIQGAQSWGLLVLVISTACLGKIVGTVVVSLLCKLPFQEAVALGFLMNTKGLVELIVLNIGKDRGVLNDQTFAIMVLMALFTTFITTPIVIAVYKPAKQNVFRSQHKQRTIERKQTNKSPLRILACFHTNRNIPSLLNLIEASRGTSGGLHVYAMHLIELTERSSAIRMVQRAEKNGLNQIIVAFEDFNLLSKVSIKSKTGISRMSNMYEDICTMAENKRVSIIILPFHKHQRLDGQFEITRSEYKQMNLNALEHGPCSVGIFVDRGLGGNSHVTARNVNSVFTVIFFGGSDDREALSYGARMAEHPGITLVVIRFVYVGEEHVKVNVEKTDMKERLSDDELFLSRFRDNSSIKFEERIVSSVDEMVEVIQESSRCNLYLVGRTPEGQLAAGLKVMSDCSDLGPVGGLLTSPEFSTTASVLVVQQYVN
ncbi:cation/H(+) antiporter 18-like [Impatiens glandulifera]|uniref:cation/H(+) antiporter 18-like n=1 Tax=Impatiens glandulifera TaxID=253017 RepID=UPI001FB0A945|nr:cation/H(+) antiporter 18-like [Impatiens glandulifera]